MVLIVGAMMLNACESAPGSDELYQEVMKYHDEAMPHMGALYKAVKKTEEQRLLLFVLKSLCKEINQGSR